MCAYLFCHLHSHHLQHTQQTFARNMVKKNSFVNNKLSFKTIVQRFDTLRSLSCSQPISIVPLLQSICFRSCLSLLVRSQNYVRVVACAGYLMCFCKLLSLVPQSWRWGQRWGQHHPHRNTESLVRRMYLQNRKTAVGETYSVMLPAPPFQYCHQQVVTQQLAVEGTLDKWSRPVSTRMSHS